jgi:hypothetical protein
MSSRHRSRLSRLSDSRWPALLDADLYLPTKRAIVTIYDALEPGGIMMVDDVTNGTVYDGAAAAYFEFCKSRNIQPRVLADKAGMLFKP